MKLIAGYEDKTAYALCTFAYYNHETNDVIVFEGKCPVSHLCTFSNPEIIIRGLVNEEF